SMKKVFSIFIFTTGFFGFTSCEKERGAAQACIDIGTSQLKTTDIVHFMNCSVNYDLTRWLVMDSVMVDTLYQAPTDTLKHFKYSFTPGKYNVTLIVTKHDSSSIDTKNLPITIIP